MSLSSEFEKQGEWLFRWRSYLPLPFIALVAIALHDYEWPFRSYFQYTIWARLCFGLSFSGLIIRCITIGYTPEATSGRNTEKQIAEQLNTTGMYSLVRHPLYLGNFLIGLGACCAPFVWWLPLIYCLLFCAYYERIMFREEAFLHQVFHKKFDEWAARTPAFFPRNMKWRQPALSFSIRTVLRREYTGLMVVILCNAGVQFTEHLIIDRRIVYEVFWVTLLIGGTTTYFAMKSLKSLTTLLNVQGR
jgi:protein-S-isoprenylcysteine O-methyltransferase Ste14